MMPCLHAVRAPDRAPENFAAIATSTKVQFSWSLPSNIVAEPSNMLLGYTLTCKPINVTGVTSMLMTYNEARSHTLGGFDHPQSTTVAYLHTTVLVVDLQPASV